MTPSPISNRPARTESIITHVAVFSSSEGVGCGAKGFVPF
jgi:hypothetical protein